MNFENEVVKLIGEVGELKAQVEILWKINLGVILASAGIIIKDIFNVVKNRQGANGAKK